ncbi:MAG TPA: hypothetical protein VIF83_01635 [Gemmatimonadaceae bacterium]|jgi:hypothetical protein
MPARAIAVDGVEWTVVPSGYVTSYDQDEFGLIFTRKAGNAGPGEIRVTRYSPQGTRSREQSFRELTDEQLRALFDMSQPSFTSPEAGYAR